ncbi:heparan-alpha-glucosaminide N-acetyltransferase domain-containing protein [Nocardia sp. NPDC004604]|uniref:heparan-alpha-glucosaminide N-acetyltransferase domain-containing protein n=1 Tax=Nocardia sp. NPDC004604 TaxID=3157013 RepID=UPI0033A12C39
MTGVLAAGKIDRNRIGAVDTARGLAVVGMIAAHTLAYGELTWSDPAHWTNIASGRSSILFAVLGGVSLALMTGRAHPPTGSDLVTVRLRVMVRAALLFLIGGILQATGTTAAVILEYYAVMFVLALPFLAWRPRRLLITAAVWAVITPVLVWCLVSVLPTSTLGTGGIVTLAISGSYPALIWVAFILIGLAIGRSDFTAIRTRLLGWGVAAAVLGYGIAWACTKVFGSGAPDLGDLDTKDVDPDAIPGPGFVSLLTAQPHSGTFFEILASGGLAVAVLGLLLSCPPVLMRILTPLTAIGYLPLTVYAAHVISLAFVDERADGNPAFFLWSVAIAAVGSLLWTRFLGRGPLERLVTWVTRAAVRTRHPAPEPTPRPQPVA